MSITQFIHRAKWFSSEYKLWDHPIDHKFVATGYSFEFNNREKTACYSDLICLFFFPFLETTEPLKGSASSLLLIEEN
jgi:hypothetical protein